MFTICATCIVISPVKCILYLYISTFRSMCAVPSMAVFCSSLTLWRLTTTILVVPHRSPLNFAFYILIQQIQVLNILNMAYTPRVFLFEMQFHNSNVFGSCIIHILYIYSTNIGTEYFKLGIYSAFFPLKNAVCFIIITYLVPVLFTFYIFIQQI